MNKLWTFCILLANTRLLEAQGGCDNGWETYNNNCYQFNTAKTINWKDATAECSALDASLVRISDTNQLQWLTKTMNAKYPASGVWTGLNDNDKDSSVKLGTGRWKWGFYTPADMTLIQWNASPANDGQSTCAGINIQGQLADVTCKSKQGAICSAPPSNNACQDGWIAADSTTCLYFTDTSDVTQLRTWSMAQEWCENQANGGDLLSLTTATQMNTVQAEVTGRSQNTKIYWVGLTATGQQWSWLTGGAPDKTVVQWQVEPNNVAGVENCGVLRMTGRFSDRDCTSNAAYICQKPVYNYTPIDNVGCGPWIRAGKSCYLFSKTVVPWLDARNKCLQQNSDLIKVDSLDKKFWLEAQMLDATSATYWSGLNDRQNEGQYIWGDGTQLNTTLITWSKEPNNYKGIEDYAVVLYNGEYNDVPGGAYHAAAICEIDNDQQRTCPIGWASNMGRCYLFSPYQNQSQLMNRDEAYNYCLQQNNVINTTVNLLSITNDDEKAFIRQTLATMKDNALGWWTSLSDAATEGYWTFADGSTPNTKDWSTEPSTAPGDNCGMINWGGVFHLRNCGNTHPYICERYAYGMSTGTVIVKSYLVIVAASLFSIFTIQSHVRI